MADRVYTIDNIFVTGSDIAAYAALCEAASAHYAPGRYCYMYISERKVQSVLVSVGDGMPHAKGYINETLTEDMRPLLIAKEQLLCMMTEAGAGISYILEGKSELTKDLSEFLKSHDVAVRIKAKREEQKEAAAHAPLYAFFRRNALGVSIFLLAAALALASILPIEYLMLKSDNAKYTELINSDEYAAKMETLTAARKGIAQTSSYKAIASGLSTRITDYSVILEELEGGLLKDAHITEMAYDGADSFYIGFRLATENLESYDEEFLRIKDERQFVIAQDGERDEAEDTVTIRIVIYLNDAAAEIEND